jgi:hypothetical protein
MARHPVDLLSFIAGVLVLALGLLLLTGGLEGLRLEWAGPVVAIGLGVLIVLAARPAGEAVAPVVAPQGSNDQAGLVSAGNRVESVPEVAPDGHPRP